MQGNGSVRRCSMSASDSLRETLDHYRSQEKQLLADLQLVRLMIARMERDSGESSSASEPAISVGVSDALPPTADRLEISNGKRPEIRPDEFFGMTQAEAARKHLKRIGHAVSFDELVTALQAGGCRVGGENPKRVLYISLVRNTRDFVPPQPGYIGLREFYPGASRPQRVKAERPPRTQKRRGKPAKKRQAAKRVSLTTRPAKRSSSELVVAVQSVLGDKQPHSVDEILTAVSSKLGHGVKRIGVLGTLRSKLFANVDGKYRLVK
jgi:hypothetical protein